MKALALVLEPELVAVLVLEPVLEQAAAQDLV